MQMVSNEDFLNEVLLPPPLDLTNLSSIFSSHGTSSSMQIKNSIDLIFTNENIVSLAGQTDRRGEELLDEVNKCLENGGRPVLIRTGVGGTYIIKDQQGKSVAVFKPQNEFAGSPSCPKISSNFRYSKDLDIQTTFSLEDKEPESSEHFISPYSQVYRECAAYHVDPDFFNVPTTALVWIRNVDWFNTEDSETFGSLQKFITPNFRENVADWSPSVYPVDEVHKLGLLDILILNVDRNGENVLVQKVDDEKLKFVCIDHGLSFPTVIDIPWSNWIWINWKQTSKPFSKDIKIYIMNFDIDDYLKRLTSVYSFSSLELDNIHSATIFLKTCVKLGLTLFAIANLVTRDKPDELSQFEKICKKAAWKKHVKRELNVEESNDLFKKSHGYKVTIISKILDNLSAENQNSIQLD
jgi:hypothetical protein